MEKYKNGRTTTARGSVLSHASLAIRTKPRLMVTTDHSGAPRTIKKMPRYGTCCTRKTKPVKRNSRIDFGIVLIPCTPISSIHPILEVTGELEQYRWDSIEQTQPIPKSFPWASSAGKYRTVFELHSSSDPWQVS